MSSYEHILVRADGPVTYITINRPQQLNALSREVLKELHTELSKLQKNFVARMVILSGSGEKAFVAGADIVAMKNMSTEEALEFAKLGHDIMLMLENNPQVSVAKVHGFALGGGCELAMACDMIIASRNAKFGQPEVNLGLIPGFGGTQRLVQKIGISRTMDLICLGRSRILSAEEAFSWGLVTRLVENDQLDAEISKMLKELSSIGPSAMRVAKDLIRRAAAQGLKDRLDFEAQMFAHILPSKEAREGMNAFCEKRVPHF